MVRFSRAVMATTSDLHVVETRPLVAPALLHGDLPIDAAALLFNKQPLQGMNGLKRYLLQERQDQFARAMVRKMTTYALGRPLSFADHAEVEDLAAEFRKRGDRLGDLIYLVTQSGIFNSK